MNILIIKLGALGDIVIATPLITAIQKAHPNDAVHLLTSAPFAPIFANWPGLHVTAHPRQGMRNTARTIHWIRRLKCARIYDLQGNDRTGVLCALSGSSIRVGNHPRFPYTHHPHERWSGQCHIFERMTDVLAAAGVGGVGTVPYLPAGAADRDAVRQWISLHALHKRRFVLLHATASSSRPEKRWPFFATLAERLNEHGLCPVWIGAANDARENRRLCAATAGVDASGAFSIAQLAELGRHAQFAVTNDSGPMHVLAAAAIPVFGLFGPSDWRRNHALGQRENVIARENGSPLSQSIESAGRLDEISLEMVWDRLALAGLL